MLLHRVTLEAELLVEFLGFLALRNRHGVAEACAYHRLTLDA